MAVRWIRFGIDRLKLNRSQNFESPIGKTIARNIGAYPLSRQFVRRSRTRDSIVLNKKCPTLSWQQFFHVFASAAIPMVGFGLMDQLIMIRLGDLIDTTIGVALGLATLSAAAVGQLCSDTAGVFFGNTIGSLAQRFGLPPPKISSLQQTSTTFGLARTLGAAFGVALGCLLGMIQLLVIDLDRADRLKHQQQLDIIFEMVMKDGPKLFHCERATLFVYDKSRAEVWSKAGFGLDEAIRIRTPTCKSITTWVLEKKEMLNLVDPYKDPRFNPNFDANQKFRTTSILAAPVLGSKDEVVAILVLANKHPEYGGVFSDDDERMLEMMCRHVQIFMEKFCYGAADDQLMLSLPEDLDVQHYHDEAHMENNQTSANTLTQVETSEANLKVTNDSNNRTLLKNKNEENAEIQNSKTMKFNLLNTFPLLLHSVGYDNSKKETVVVKLNENWNMRSGASEYLQKHHEKSSHKTPPPYWNQSYPHLCDHHLHAAAKLVHVDRS